jgi:hypothetical protein
MTNLVDRGTMDAGLAEQIDRHDRALESRDLTSLEILLTEDFIQVAPNGTLRNRTSWFDWFSGIVRYDQMRRTVIVSRSYAVTRIVLSECFPVMRVRDGEPSVHTAIMLELWTNRDGSWRKAIEQYTRPAQNPASAP